MGINFTFVEKMEQVGIFEQRACRILDIGSSNVYDAYAANVAAFVRRHNPQPRADLDAWAAQIEINSKFDPLTGGTNKAFIGEVFEAAGMIYESIDITPGYRTNILDLNRQRLPDDFVGGFDIALNFGTTEHIFNQINCFSAIHHAVVRGGYMYHQLPNVGHVNHGYYCYTGRFFFDLAGFNKYDVVDCWFERAQMTENLFEPVRAYERTFPALTKVLARLSSDEHYRSLSRIAVPVVGINVVFRKMIDAPFVGAMEFSTTVGDVSAAIKDQYIQSDLNEAPVGMIETK